MNAIERERGRQHYFFCVVLFYPTVPVRHSSRLDGWVVEGIVLDICPSIHTIYGNLCACFRSFFFFLFFRSSFAKKKLMKNDVPGKLLNYAISKLSFGLGQKTCPWNRVFRPVLNRSPIKLFYLLIKPLLPPKFTSLDNGRIIPK